MSGLPFVALCLPSRGLIHSRTIDAVLAALAYAAPHADMVGWFMTHDLPIPDCHETLAERAMAAGAEYVWFVEEDMIPPPDALTRLLDRQRETGAGIVTLDYPLGEHPTHSALMRHEADGGSIWWCGLGCTLITRDVFTRLARPWFRSEHPGAFVRSGERGPWRWQDTPPGAAPHTHEYGGQDIWLCYQATRSGFTIETIPGLTAGHARLRSWGAQHTNHGAHTVDILRDIEVYHAG